MGRKAGGQSSRGMYSTTTTIVFLLKRYMSLTGLSIVPLAFLTLMNRRDLKHALGDQIRKYRRRFAVLYAGKPDETSRSEEH